MRGLSYILLVCVILSCKKKEPKKPSTDPQFTFVSLTADATTLKQGDVTNIKANVTGTVTYAWSITAGDVFGSGNNVLFAAGSCCTGNHTVTCKVTDSNNNSDSKSVVINVIN